MTLFYVIIILLTSCGAGLPQSTLAEMLINVLPKDNTEQTTYKF